MKKAMVYGAGVSGKSAKELLELKGYSVIMVDDGIGMSSKVAMEKLDEIELFIKSPGIPYNELVNKVKKIEKIEMIDEIELAYRYMNKKIKLIAITGTNGKTTTTSKIKDLLEYAEYRVEYAGNIGVPFSKIVLENKDLDYIVLELSSYQLENIKEFKAEISLIINLSPDHLTRYKSVDEYYNAKLNVLKNFNSTEDLFILNIDDDEILKRVVDRKNILKISLEENKEAHYFVKGSKVIENLQSDKELELLDREKLNLKGVHNLQNILFITAVARKIGIEKDMLIEFLYSTKPLEHRMEEFFDFQNTKFINDSKGTNVDSTIKAINAFEGKIYLICGGKDKNVDLQPLVDTIKTRVSEVFLIGETANMLEELLLKSSFSRSKIKNLRTIEKVIMNLVENKNFKEAAIVLFSPAHSSFDQFKNYEERGKIFKKLVVEVLTHLS